MMKGKQIEKVNAECQQAMIANGNPPEYEPKHLDGEPRLAVYQKSPGGKWCGFLEIFKVNVYQEPDGGFWVPERDLANYASYNGGKVYHSPPTELEDVDKDVLVGKLTVAASTAWDEVLNEKHQEDTTEQIYMSAPPSGSQKRIV